MATRKTSKTLQRSFAGKFSKSKRPVKDKEGRTIQGEGGTKEQMEGALRRASDQINSTVPTRHPVCRL
jgi:hypothetical protein